MKPDRISVDLDIRVSLDFEPDRTSELSKKVWDKLLELIQEETGFPPTRLSVDAVVDYHPIYRLGKGRIQ